MNFIGQESSSQNTASENTLCRCIEPTKERENNVLDFAKFAGPINTRPEGVNRATGSSNEPSQLFFKK